MNELHLFAGAGGGILASILLGHRVIGAVEWDEYCCKVLRQRQLDGCLGKFPIWHMDIRDFNERVAPTYKGLVDIIAAGFPCQPFSNAGNRLGEYDPRNQWPETIRSIRIIRPTFGWLENVPGLLSNEYFGVILRELSESGYDARWKVISAAEVGAPHFRDRLWIMAYPKCSGLQGGLCKQRDTEAQRRTWLSELERLHGEELELAVPTGKSGGMSDGVAHRHDRLKAIGNGQVPLVAATAWRILSGGLIYG